MIPRFNTITFGKHSIKYLGSYLWRKRATCGRLIRARINDCHRRLNYYNDKIQQRLDKLKQLLSTTLLSTIQTIADKRADKTAEQDRAKAKQNLTRLQDTKNDKLRKPDANWVRNISSRPLD